MIRTTLILTLLAGALAPFLRTDSVPAPGSTSPESRTTPRVGSPS